MGFFQSEKGQFYKEDPAQRKKEIRWLLQKMGQHRVMIAAVAGMGLLATVMSLAGSVASKYLVDAVTGQSMQRLWTAGVIMVVMILGSLVLQAVSSRLSAAIHVKIRNRNQHKVYGRILQAGWEALEPYRSGDLLHRLTADVSVVSDGVISFLPSLLTALVRFAGAFVIMVIFDPAMALIALLGTPVLLLLSRFLMRHMRQHNQIIKDMNGQIMSFQEDSFRNLTSIKAFSITDRFSEQMQNMQQSYEKAYLSYNASQIRMSSVLSLAGTVVTGACFCWGVYRLWTQDMTYGSLTMFLQLASTLRAAFSALLSLAQQSVSLTTSAGRIMAVEELPGEETLVPEGMEKETQLSVRLEAASFSYQDGEPVLHPFTFTAQPDDMIAITGPSGEGKTTLLRLLLGLITVQSGSAALVGGSGTRYPLSAGTRGVFAYVPQGNSIFAGTIAQNLRMVQPEATDEQLEQVLEIACALDFVKQLPDGLNHMLGAGGRGISEGQAQRLAIARALLRKAPILLLDEATSAMDVQMEKKLLENLCGSGFVQTCILVTHRPASAQFCNRAYDIRDGVVTEVDHGA